MAREANQPGARGALIGIHRSMGQMHLKLGDIAQAEAQAREMSDLLGEFRTAPAFQVMGSFWEGEIELLAGSLAEAKGQFRDAEAAYLRSETARRDALAKRPRMPDPPPQQQIEEAIDNTIVQKGRMKAAQGRLAEGEADVRRALLSRLKAYGRYNIRTIGPVLELAAILAQQGRYPEVEKLLRAALEIHDALGVRDVAALAIRPMTMLARTLAVQGRWQEANEVYGKIDKASQSWDPKRRKTLNFHWARVISLYNAGQVEMGIELARSWTSHMAATFGEKHLDTAMARGALAVGLIRAQRYDEAAREFAIAVPILLTAKQQTDEDDTGTPARQDYLIRLVLES